MYEIMRKDGRYIVYRVHRNKHLRQGSFSTEQEALDRIEQSRKNLGE
jgi:hypothetical protein